MLRNKFFFGILVFCVIPLSAMQQNAKKPLLQITPKERQALQTGYGNNRILIQENLKSRRYVALLSNGDCLVAEHFFADDTYTYRRCKNGWQCDMSNDERYFNLLETIYCAKNYRV